MKNKLYIFIILMIFISIILISNSIAENITEDTNTIRDQEIQTSNIIAMIILIIFLSIIGVYVYIDRAAKSKHITKAKLIAKKARFLVREFEQEEEDQINKEKEIEKKAAIVKSKLEKNMHKTRYKHSMNTSNSLFSEFEDEDELLKPTSKYDKQRRKDRDDIFLNLNKISKDLKHSKKSFKKKKSDSALFDKLEKISK